ncbi:MAG: hypothetical protein ACR2KN_08120 [Geodermatophilaceae bacterium]
MARHARPGNVCGRHRRGRADRVYCREIEAVDRALSHRRVRWVHYLRPARRHSWAFLARTGGNPRAAFALILSL